MSDEAIYKKIVEDLRNEREDVIATLYDSYSDALYGVIFRIVKQEELAAEILQNTFVKIWQNGKSYDPKKGRLFTWMMRIARNLSLNAIDTKHFKIQKEIQSVDNSVYDIGGAEDRGVHLTDIKIHVENLDAKYSEVIDLVFFQGYTHQDASDHLDIPLGTIKSRIKIALRDLRKIYDYDNSSLIIMLGSMILLS